MVKANLRKSKVFKRHVERSNRMWRLYFAFPHHTSYYGDGERLCLNDAVELVKGIGYLMKSSCENNDSFRP